MSAQRPRPGPQTAASGLTAKPWDGRDAPCEVHGERTVGRAGRGILLGPEKEQTTKPRREDTQESEAHTTEKGQSSDSSSAKPGSRHADWWFGARGQAGGGDLEGKPRGYRSGGDTSHIRPNPHVRRASVNNRSASARHPGNE